MAAAAAAAGAAAAARMLPFAAFWQLSLRVGIPIIITCCGCIPQHTSTAAAGAAVGGGWGRQRGAGDSGDATGRTMATLLLSSWLPVRLCKQT
jgi:hypothetical protein